jgi:hypothetical protein
MSSIYTKLNKAYKVSCPIVTLTTSDPAQAIKSVIAALPDCQVINWDIAQGVTVPPQKNQNEAVAAAATLGENALNLTEALVTASDKLPKSTVLIIQNAHRFLDRDDVMQAVWNIRDAWKSPRRMLILMGPSVKIPVELQHDVIELDEPLPTKEELATVIKSVTDAASVKISKEQLSDGAAASQGLSAFAAEQLAALNLTKADGISVGGVWADKCSKINETPGLRVVSGGSFADVAGVENVKTFLSKIMTGKDRPNAVVWVEELDKVMGGSSSDTSGVSQDQLGVQLQWMQEKKAKGLILFGVPGAAKSAIAKVTGGQYEIPTIQLDAGAMKGSLVGESEARIRTALKVIDSVSGGKTIWIATCNAMTQIPPELRRRYCYGVWMFDMPTREERMAIWDLYVNKLATEQPDDNLIDREWTGAEIETCCTIASNTNMKLHEAAKYIVPVAISGAEQVAAMRNYADGRFLSASYEGVYKKSPVIQSTPTARTFD